MHPADAACHSKRGAACRLAHFSAATAVLAARSFCNRLGGSAAAINLARSVRTVLAADAACLGKRGAAFRRARFLVATAMLAARSFRYRYGGSVASAERAEPKGAVFHAEPTSLNSCTTLCSSADLRPPTMLPTNPAC